jgi:hypothetical protein
LELKKPFSTWQGKNISFDKTIVSFTNYLPNRDIKKRLIDTQQAQQTRQREEVKLDSSPIKNNNNGSGGCC